MGKITEVYYQEVDSSDVDLHTAGQFYFNHNLLGTSQTFHDDYEVAETKQLRAKNRLIGEAMRQKDIPALNVPTSLLAISPIKNKVILIADIR